jgi:hypothetical protein
MKGFKSTSTNPYTYTQSGVWKKGQYTFQAVVLSDSGYAFAFQRADTTWQTIDLSWQVKDGSYSKIQWTFTLEVDAVAFRLIANTVTGETIVVQPMLEKGTNGSTPIAHEEDLRGMDGDNHEFIFTRNTTGIAPETPLSTQDDDYVPEGWTDNAQGVTSEIPFEFVSMRERKNGVWLDFSPPSLWAKWGEDGLSVNLLVEGHYKSHWEGTTKVVEIVGGVDVGGSEVVKVSAVFRKGEENIAATVSQSRGFQWYVNGVHLTDFDNQPFITLDETYGDGFADYVVLSYLVNSIREEERREIINISEGMDGIGEEFIFKANNSDIIPPVLPQTTDVGYQNDDYHGDWSDDPVAPTELNQFVWVAKRKKIGGIWEAFGTPSVWTKWVEDGSDATYWSVKASAPVIYKDAVNAATSGTHTPVTVSGELRSGTTTTAGGFITVTPNGGTEAGTATASPVTIAPANGDGKTSYRVRLYDTAAKTTLLDIMTIPVVFKGASGVNAISAVLSNEADVLPASSEGVVSDYTGSGTEIRVFEGATELSYGTGIGQFQVSASGSGITVGTPSTSGNRRVYGVASNMTSDNATITFTITGKTASGTSFSLTKVQSFSKSRTGQKGDTGASAQLLYLSASAQAMKCNPDNTPQAGQTISIEANLQNVTGTATFVATPYNDAGTALAAITLGGSGNTRTLTNAQWLATFKRVEVVATLGSLTDKVTIYRVADGATGQNAIVGLLTNESVTLQANNAGTVSSFTPANGEFWVYNGTTKVTSGVTFSKVSETGCTAAITSAGAYSVSAMSADNATVVLRAVYGGVTIDKVFTLSKSKAGADGTPAKSIHLNPSTKAIYITEGNIPVPASVTVTGTAVNTTIQNWYYSANGATSFTITAPTGVIRSGNQVTIYSAFATFKTLSIKARNSTDDVEAVVTITRGGGAPYVDETTNTWWAWNEELGVYTDTGYSPVGSDGAIPYPAGYYDNTKWYRREAEYAPYVQYRGTLYLLIKDTPNAGIPTTNTEYWKAFNNWKAVFVDSLVAAFAKIGGAVFTGDTTGTSSGIRGRLISETGVKSGADNTNYIEYVGDTGSWIPKLMLDFLTGAAYFGAKKIMFNPDGSGHIANGNIEWDIDGNTVTEGLIRIPFEDGNYSYAPTPKKLRNYVFTNNNDYTVWYLPEDSELNGVRVMFINWRTSTKTLRLNNTRFFGQWYSGDTKRFDIPVNGYCEMVGFSLGTAFQGWLITNSGTII